MTQPRPQQACGAPPGTPTAEIAPTLNVDRSVDKGGQTTPTGSVGALDVPPGEPIDPHDCYFTAHGALTADRAGDVIPPAWAGGDA